MKFCNYKKRILNFFLFLVFFFKIYNAIAQKDPLQNSPSQKSIELLKKELEAVDNENNSLKEYYQKAILKKALKEKKIQEILRSSLELSFIKQQNDELEEALSYTENAIVFFGKIENDSLKMAIWRQKGAVLFLQANYEKALLNYYKARELAESINDEYANLVIDMNIGLVKLQINRIGEGLDTFLKILSFLDKIGQHNFSIENKDFYIKTLQAISKVYVELKDYDTAMHYHKLGLKKSIEFNDIRREIVFLSGMGRIYGEKGEYKKSIEMLTQGEVKLLEYGNYKRLFSFIYLLKGENFFKMKSYEKAIENLLKAEKNINETGIDNLDLQERYPLLARSYQALGDYENSHNYFNKYVNLDKNNDQKRLSLSNSFSNKYDLEGLKKELDSLQSEKNRKEFNYKWMITLLIISLIITSVIMVGIREKQQTYKKQFETLMTKPNNKEKALKVDLVSDDKAKEILEKLTRFENQKNYLNQKCTLNEVAKKLKTNTSYLSTVINKYKRKSFSVYLSDLRIDNAVSRLSEDKKFRSYSIKSIAEESGFNRAESFSKTFKNKTGIYPSYFIKELKKRDLNS